MFSGFGRRGGVFLGWAGLAKAGTVNKAKRLTCIRGADRVPRFNSRC